MAALLPLPIKCGKGDVVVKPMTLGMWAALERIGSPLVTDEEPKDSLELIPSLYLLTHDPREVFRGNVIDLAMQWADTVPVSTMHAIQRACYRQMNAAFDVIPEEDDEKKRKARQRRLDCRARTLGSHDLQLGLRGNHVVRPALRDLSPPAADVPEQRRRNDHLPPVRN